MFKRILDALTLRRTTRKAESVNVNQLLALDTGDEFVVDGHRYICYGRTSWTWGIKDNREYADVPVYRPDRPDRSRVRVYYTGSRGLPSRYMRTDD